MRYFLLVFCWLAGTTLAVGQQPGRSVGTGKGLVQGTLVDSLTGKPLREASVSLLAARDSAYLSFTITDGDGHFSLRNVATGRYWLLFNFLGYKNRLYPVQVTGGGAVVQLGTLPLRALSHTLGEVVVTQERAPVSVQGDTLAFSARAFKTQPNAAVESLLKKLPGLEVDRDGTIRARGQNVQRVLVDGKPFFGDDPKMATRNLPADLIDQVQLYNQRSDQAAFSGIDDGQQQPTLNLVTKRDKRKGYFGQNSLGAGSDGRYQARLNVHRFRDGRQLSVVGQANNLNQLDFGDTGSPAAGDASLGPGLNLGSSTLPGGFGSANAAGGPNSVSGNGRSGRTVSSPGSANQSTGLAELLAGGLNYRDAWGKRAEVAASYFASQTDLANDQQIRRANVATGTTGPKEAALLTQQQLASNSRVHNQRLNLRLDYVLDSLTSVRFTPSLWWRTNDEHTQNQQQSSLLDQLLNQSQTRYATDARTLWGGGDALLMRKFRKDGRRFSANLNTILNNQTSDATNLANNTFYPPTGAPSTTLLNQQIAQENPARTHTLNLAYVEPLSLSRKLELHYTLADARSYADRNVRDFDEATNAYTQPNALLSNTFRSAFTTHRAGLLVQTQRLRYSYHLGLDAQQSDLQADNRTADILLARRYQRLLPNAMISLNGGRSRTLRLTYRTRLQAPTAGQLQPVADNTNPLNVRLGNPTLRPEYVHTVQATYSQFNAANNRSVYALLSGNQVQHRIVAATTVAADGVQTTRPVNADGYATLNGFLSLGQRLPWHKLNLNLTTNVTLTRSTSFVNEQPNAARTWTLSQGASLNSAFNDQLEFGLRGNLAYQRATYALLPQQNTSFFTQTLTADAYYQLPGRWVLTSELWLTNTTGRAAGYNQRVVLWNASLARQFFRNKQGELRLQVYDLLRQNRSVVRNVTDTYLEDVRSQVLTRYFLLSFTYNLRQFGK